MNGSVGLVALDGLTQILLGLLELAKLEVRPAQRIQVSAVHGFDVHGLANQLERLRQANPLVGQHVSQIIERCGTVRFQVQRLAEELLGGVQMLLPLGQRALQEQQVGAVFRFVGERGSLGVSVVGVFPAAHFSIELAQLQPHGAVFIGVVEQAPGQGNGFVVLALFNQGPGQHQLHVRVLGICVRSLARQVRGLIEHLGVDVGLHLLFNGALCAFAAHVDHLLVSGNGLVGLILFVIDRAQMLEEKAAVALFLGGVSAVGMRGQLDHLLEGLRSLVKAAQHVQQVAFLEAGFERRGVLLARFANGGERVLEFSLAELNLGHIHQRLGIFRIGFGQQLELLQGLVKLVVVEQRLAQRVQRMRVTGVHAGGALIGGNGILGLLQLVIGRAQGGFHLGAAVVHRDGLNDLGRVGKVAALGVKARQVQNHLFGVGLNGLGGLELVFRLLGLVLHGVELAQHHAVFDALRLQRHNPLKLDDGQVQGVAGGRR